jgi:hypothetical protein
MAAMGMDAVIAVTTTEARFTGEGVAGKPFFHG